MSHFKNYPTLSEVKVGDLFYTDLYEDGRSPTRFLLRREEFSPNNCIYCLNLVTGKVYDLPPWKKVELYHVELSDVLSTSVDE